MPWFGTEPYLVTLGDHVQISGNVTFLTHDGSTWVLESREDFPKLRKFGRISVEDNCFIGHGVIILPGVTIGANSIVGAGSVVTRDVPPCSVAAGNPARRICSVDDYALRSKRRTRVVDEEAYAADKRAELVRVYSPAR